jgi:hypothetical protein
LLNNDQNKASETQRQEGRMTKPDATPEVSMSKLAHSFGKVSQLLHTTLITTTRTMRAARKGKKGGRRKPDTTPEGFVEHVSNLGKTICRSIT